MTQTADSALATTLAEAQRRLDTGDVKAAATLYRSILDRHPRHAEAAYGIGTISYQVGQLELALNNLSTALEEEPQNPKFLRAAGEICRHMNLPERGVEHYRSAINADPNNPELREEALALLREVIATREVNAQRHFCTDGWTDTAERDRDMGDLWHQMGEPAIAERYYLRGLATRPPRTGREASAVAVPDLEPGQNPFTAPANWETTVHLGQEVDLNSVIDAPVYAQLLQRLAEIDCLRQQWASAIARCSEAVQILPDYPEAYKTLGNALISQGDVQGAANAYATATRLKPDFAEAHSNLGSAFLSKNQLQEAIACYQQAIATQPDTAGFHWNLGNALEKAGKIPEAVAAWQRAINLAPDAYDAYGYYRIAHRLLMQERREEATQWYERLIAKFPGFLYAHWDLCEMLCFSSNLPYARFAADRCLANVTDTPVNRILAAIIYIKIYCFIGIGFLAKDHFQAIEAEIYDHLSEFNANDLTKLYVNLLFDVPHIRDDVGANNKLANVLGTAYLTHLKTAIANTAQRDGTPPALQLAQPVGRSPQAPLRIGFMSKHYRRHSVGWCSGDIMQHLRQHTPHLIFYVTGDQGRDDRTELFNRVAEKFYWPGSEDYPNTSGLAIAQRATADNLDVLVDLDSITVLPHAEVLHRHPAPVCLTWLGYDAPHICPQNYNLVDWHTHPAGVEHFYVEKLVRMPGSFAAISGLPISRTSRTLQRRAQRITEDQVAYLCVATGQKVSKEMLEAQVHILRHVPNSILFYKCRVGDMDTIWLLYQEECQRQGVHANRIRFLPRTAREEDHRTAYLMTDVLLDSYPYSGATHDLEALWFNLPIVTRIGEQSFSRLGYSLMRAAGLDNEGMTWSWDEYIEWGVRYGRDRNLRQAVQEKLRRAKDPSNPALLWNPKQFAADFYAICQDLRSKVDFGSGS
jgi:predicted O-linked N-acetylglucosamine transferase (SPINDLY family)